MLYLLLRKLHVVVEATQTIAVTVFSRSECISPGALVSLCSQEFLSALIGINKCNAPVNTLSCSRQVSSSEMEKWPVAQVQHHARGLMPSFSICTCTINLLCQSEGIYRCLKNICSYDYVGVK